MAGVPAGTRSLHPILSPSLSRRGSTVKLTIDKFQGDKVLEGTKNRGTGKEDSPVQLARCQSHNGNE